MSKFDFMHRAFYWENHHRHSKFVNDIKIENNFSEECYKTFNVMAGVKKLKIKLGAAEIKCDNSLISVLYAATARVNEI